MDCTCYDVCQNSEVFYYCKWEPLWAYYSILGYSTRGPYITLHFSPMCILSALITKANMDGRLMGVPTLKRGLEISHFFSPMTAYYFAGQI
jgi:hypothetical protein